MFVFQFTLLLRSAELEDPGVAEQVNVRIEGCIIVSVSTTPRYIVSLFSLIHNPIFSCQEKLAQGKKEIVLL